MKAKTIDDLCKKEAGTFKKFIQQKEGFLLSVEKERKDRIRAAKSTAREMVWAS